MCEGLGKCSFDTMLSSKNYVIGCNGGEAPCIVNTDGYCELLPQMPILLYPYNLGCISLSLRLFFLFQAVDSEEAAPGVEATDIDPTELLEVSAEHETQGSSADQPSNGLVNDITKQQMIVQFLKVGEFTETSSY